MSVPARSGSQAVERALSVLDRFEGDRSLSLSDLVTEVGLPPSTTHRILQALCRSGYLVRRAGAYRLGPRVPALLPRSDLVVDEIVPHLYALAAGVRLVVSLGVRGDSTMDTIFSARPPVEHCASQLPDASEPLHATAMGKVLLAFSSDGPSVALRGIGELARFTPRTSTSYADLLAQLNEARRRGFAVSDRERVDGVRELAVPIVGDSGAVAALGVRASSERLTDELMRKMLPPLHRAAGEAGRRIRDLERVG